MTVRTYKNSEIKKIDGQYVVYIGREKFGTYPTFEQADKQARLWNGDVLLN